MQRPVQHKIPLTAAILAVIVTFQSVGWLLAWLGLQFEASIEAQRILFQEESELSERTFHPIDLQKLKIGSHEIRLNGQLFDYRILSETSDSIRVALYHDQQEQALLCALGRVFKTEDNTHIPSSTPVALWLAKWLGSTFILPEKLLISSGVTPAVQRQHFTTRLFTAQSAPSVFAPPPEL